MGYYGNATPLLRDHRLRRALALFDRNCALTIAGLAQSVSLTPDHLERLFKEETGRHLSDILAEYRLQRAAYLLSHTNVEIKEIAFTVGYAHASSFVRAFERRFATSPKQFRLRAAS